MLPSAGLIGHSTRLPLHQIDVESLDLAILRTLDFARYRPRIICTETLLPATGRMRTDTAEFLTQQGYESRAMTLANPIFVDRRETEAGRGRG